MKHTDDELDQTWRQVRLAAEEGDHRTLILLLKRLDRLGVWRATSRIGEFYELGAIGVDRNLDEAINWYRKAVFESDDPIAHLGLGRIYYEGCASAQVDMHKARLHLLRAYSRGCHQAGLQLGQIYIFGMGVEANLDEAEIYLSEAANSGVAIAFEFLASIEAKRGHGLKAVMFLLHGRYLKARLQVREWRGDFLRKTARRLRVA